MTPKQRNAWKGPSPFWLMKLFSHLSIHSTYHYQYQQYGDRYCLFCTRSYGTSSTFPCWAAGYFLKGLEVHQDFLGSVRQTFVSFLVSSGFHNITLSMDAIFAHPLSNKLIPLALYLWSFCDLLNEWLVYFWSNFGSSAFFREGSPLFLIFPFMEPHRVRKGFVTVSRLIDFNNRVSINIDFLHNLKYRVRKSWWRLIHFYINLRIFIEKKQTINKKIPGFEKSKIC